MIQITENVDLSALDPVDLGLDGDRWRAFRPVQQEGIAYTLFGPEGDGGRAVVGLGAPTGCVAGDTRITTNRRSIGKTWTIEQFYKAQYRSRARRLTPDPTRVRASLGNRIGLHPLCNEEVVWSGYKLTWELALCDGKALRATEDHLIMTPEGWQPLCDLSAGKWVTCEGVPGKHPKPVYPQIQGLRFHRYANGVEARGTRKGTRKPEGRLYRVPTHRLIMEAAINGVEPEELIRICKTEPTEARKLVLLDPLQFVVHHKDRDTMNFQLSNLEIMTRMEHMGEHGIDNARNFAAPVHVKVANVTRGQCDQTYDLKCQDPYHNFIANGIVVHNSGKSLYAVAVARAAWEWRGWRTAVLTATRALEDQYALKDFPPPALIDVRGRDNYDCHYVPEGATCKDVEDVCPHAGNDRCPYRRQVRTATDSPVVLTNYQYWLSVKGQNAGALGEFQMVICDEGHAAVEEVGRYLGAWAGYRDLAKWNAAWTGMGASGIADAAVRRGLAGMALKISRELDRLADERSERNGRGRKTAAQRRLEDVLKNVTRVVDLSADGPWLWQSGDKGVRFDPVWPGRYARRYLQTAGVEKLVFLSATLRPKTLALMNFARTAYDFREWPRQFPPQLSPVYYWPVARMTYGNTDDWGKLVQAVNDIALQRCDRKGIVHTVSYDRAEALSKEMSSLLPDPILCKRGEAAWAAEKLKKADAGTVLITPSHGTGFDFPETDCEYQIIAKLPFGNTSGPLAKAREADDPDYGLYETMQAVVQMCGRATRHEKDRSECFILDKAWPFLWSRAKVHAPSWFRTYDIQAVPKRPPKL